MLADEVDYGLDALGRCLGQYPVSQVENVTRAPRRPIEHVQYLGLKLARWCQQSDRIEVPLDAAIGEALPSLVERDAPVHADQVAAGFTHEIEQRSGARSKVNERGSRFSRRGNCLGRVRQHEAVVIVR